MFIEIYFTTYRVPIYFLIGNFLMGLRVRTKSLYQDLRFLVHKKSFFYCWKILNITRNHMQKIMPYLIWMINDVCFSYKLLHKTMIGHQCLLHCTEYFKHDMYNIMQFSPKISDTIPAAASLCVRTHWDQSFSQVCL